MVKAQPACRLGCRPGDMTGNEEGEKMLTWASRSTWYKMGTRKRSWEVKAAGVMRWRACVVWAVAYRGL